MKLIDAVFALLREGQALADARDELVVAEQERERARDAAARWYSTVEHLEEKVATLERLVAMYGVEELTEADDA